MIFVTLGSQKFQFNRLLEEIDILIEKNSIKEEVFAQIGYSDYKPKHYKFKEFLDRDEFVALMEKCCIVVTHGGTGAIITAVKKNKKVIALPRLAQYGEHVDDHQIQIVEQFSNLNLIKGCIKKDDLEKCINQIYTCNFNKYNSNTQKIIKSIEKFIQ